MLVVLRIRKNRWDVLFNQRLGTLGRWAEKHPEITRLGRHAEATIRGRVYAFVPARASNVEIGAALVAAYIERGN